MRRDIFQAIADPTRRAIIIMLVLQPLNINNVADQFSASWPAISKHMKILTECGLVTITRQGRERYCHANFSKLKEVADWTAHYQKFGQGNWMPWGTSLNWRKKKIEHDLWNQLIDKLGFLVNSSVSTLSTRMPDVIAHIF